VQVWVEVVRVWVGAKEEPSKGWEVVMMERGWGR
jgi:hypothetical protein